MTHTLAPGAGGFDTLTLEASSGASARISALGAHLLNWRTPDGIERIFTSETAVYEVGGAIRGGVPVCFPQFAGLGPLATKHGFARGLPWTLDAADSTGARWTLTDSAATRAHWDHAFAASIFYELAGAELRMALRITNTGSAPFTFTGALHPYFRVQDIAQVSIAGLQGARFRRSSEDGRGTPQTEADLTFSGPVDRIYFDVTGPVTIHDGDRRLTVTAGDGFRDVVVWNPWIENSRAMVDMEPDGYQRMVCVEAAVIEEPVTLAPGQDWQGTQTVTAEITRD
jgi:glucose-6-phosphate 1-epimerase